MIWGIRWRLNSRLIRIEHACGIGVWRGLWVRDSREFLLQTLQLFKSHHRLELKQLDLLKCWLGRFLLILKLLLLLHGSHVIEWGHLLRPLLVIGSLLMCHCLALYRLNSGLTLVAKKLVLWVFLLETFLSWLVVHHGLYISSLVFCWLQSLRKYFLSFLRHDCVLADLADGLGPRHQFSLVVVACVHFHRLRFHWRLIILNRQSSHVLVQRGHAVCIVHRQKVIRSSASFHF